MIFFSKDGVVPDTDVFLKPEDAKTVALEYQRAKKSYESKKEREWFCSKCGISVSDIKWKVDSKNDDYLQIKCFRCGYYWHEDCLDKGKKENER